ncbi:MAG: riboflavin synthase [Ruminococcus sp.]|nr:riboflavin synthase [Ruminococcus sp.]MBQ3856309.1 riboflavin synthase [Ruminococcus sp.]
MFTGLIEETGKVSSLRRGGNSSFIRIQAEKVLEGTVTGDSIAVNGVCLTVTEMGSGWFQADVMNETLARSSLGSLKPGDPVNLERAMAAGGRFGGHIVSGHIDGTGTVTDIKNDGIAVWYTITADPQILRYIVEKGSVALDGISLTVAKVTAESFSVSVIPHTAEVTTLSKRKTGDKINIENDIIGKYVEKLMKPAESSSGGLSMGFLAENGFI